MTKDRRPERNGQMVPGVRQCLLPSGGQEPAWPWGHLRRHLQGHREQAMHIRGAESSSKGTARAAPQRSNTPMSQGNLPANPPLRHPLSRLRTPASGCDLLGPVSHMVCDFLMPLNHPSFGWNLIVSCSPIVPFLT